MRIAVLSDIHSNLVALDAVLADIGTVDAVWHLGDVVGYGPEPDAVVERLAGIGAVGVRGNHDAAAVGGPEIEAFNPEARRAMEWTRARIAPATRDWLAALPERLIEDDASLVHGSLRDPTWEYVTSAAIAKASLDVHDDPARAARPHPRPDGVDPRRAAASRGAAAGRTPGSPTTAGPRCSTLAASASRATATRARATWSSTPTRGSRRWHRVAYDIEAVDRRDAGGRAAGPPGRAASPWPLIRGRRPRSEGPIAV